ncbi:MAG: hypothetical protein AAFX06_34420, partial [Planctomycetota bacterium]
ALIRATASDLDPRGAAQAANVVRTHQMGMGQFIFLHCPCGFRSNRVHVGSLLAHESSLNGYTVIVATFDVVKREILTHSACLPHELDTADDDSEIDD